MNSRVAAEFFFFIAALAFASTAPAEVRTKTIDYEVAGVKLAGYLAWDDAVGGRRPGVLVAHEWWGLNDYARSRAQQVAELGYVAFVADMYGKGVRARDADHARQLSGEVFTQGHVRPRALAALEILAKQETVDPGRIAAIGYCFGGNTVLQLTYAGAPVLGVVSFHGGLIPPTPDDEQHIQASILILHGADDPFIPADRITAVQEALRRSKTDWQMVYFGGAQHSFTVPTADGSLPGAVYNAAADRRSWEMMQDFLDELFNQRLRAETCGTINNVHAFGGTYLAGQPSPEDFKLLKERGVKAVINLRTDGEIRGFDEKKVVESLGMEYHHLPFRSADTLTDDVFAKARQLLSQEDAGVVVHCGSAGRVGALWLVKRTLDDGLPFDAALQEARQIGLRTPEYEAKAKAYIDKQRRGR